MTRFFKQIVRDYLDPTERVSEILFGAIMVLTFTLGAGMIVHEGRAGARELLIATVGCNIAWGIIDGIICIMLRVSDRARKMNLAVKVRSISDDGEAAEEIAKGMDLEFGELLTGDTKRRISADILQHVRRTIPEKPRIGKSDLLGALASFILVFISTVPAAVPFIFLDDPRFALRISNGLLIGMLFWTGYKWAAHVRMSRLAGGLSMTAIGAALVGIAVLFGG